MTTSDDEIREMLSARAARADGVRVGPILDRALHAPAAGSTRPRWWRAVLGVGGVAAAGVALAIAVVWFAGGSQPGPSASGAAVVGASPIATPTSAPTPTSTPSASSSPRQSPLTAPTASPGPSATRVCAAADLTARILDWQGAAGSRIADIELTSLGGQSCLILGTPEVVLLNAHGKTLIDSVTSGSGPARVRPTETWFLVSPGHPLKTQVEASNYCGSTPALPVTVALVLAGAGGGPLVATPLTAGVDEAEAVPPCNGQGSPATITTNGWSR